MYGVDNNLIVILFSFNKIQYRPNNKGFLPYVLTPGGGNKW
ncbi:Uncharacterized protein dnm_040030 [Desulfonema magnum]|uniref:Uncharacterized protein n=1 Tax=Desulfonema magnum TaxID=45655 RepID=A0A975BLK6_9BACT|nr:Uncharacterized protein dnm_040030 [Desulfonema magnum]